VYIGWPEDGFDPEIMKQLTQVIDSLGLNATSLADILNGSPRPPRPNNILSVLYSAYVYDDNNLTYNHPSVQNFHKYLIVEGKKISTHFLKSLMEQHNSKLDYFHTGEYKYIRCLVKQKYAMHILDRGVLHLYYPYSP